jgi:hypothetical protein
MCAPSAEIVHGPDRLQFVFPRDLLLEILALRQQLTVPQARHFPTKAHSSRQSLLGNATAVLVGVEAHACPVQPDTAVRCIEPVSSG